MCRVGFVETVRAVGLAAGLAATKAIERETRFGMGASFQKRRQHDVMDADWRISSVTARMKDRAWAQLGTSGSGNSVYSHFTWIEPCVSVFRSNEDSAPAPVAPGADRPALLRAGV